MSTSTKQVRRNQAKQKKAINEKYMNNQNKSGVSLPQDMSFEDVTSNFDAIISNVQLLQEVIRHFQGVKVILDETRRDEYDTKLIGVGKTASELITNLEVVKNRVNSLRHIGTVPDEEEQYEVLDLLGTLDVVDGTYNALNTTLYTDIGALISADVLTSFVPSSQGGL